ncbi:glucose-6-phosphate isomerase [Candidatus Margulisiibacteriota bacterium]
MSRSVKTEHLYFDYSRQSIDDKTLELLIKLANEKGLEHKIKAMFAGEKINETEDRSVLHVALRDLTNPKPEVKEVLGKIEKFSAGNSLRNIVAIGIGGSYLGPEYLATALRPYAIKGRKLIFIANVDGTDFVEKTEGLNPEETLFVIVSKTFTTAETMQNARTAKAWLLKGLKGQKDAIKKHFVAVSTAIDKCKEFGIEEDRIFGFWDWVGGRFSATSAVGAVPLSLYLGFDNFKKVLEGAHWLDEHFRTAPFKQNIPVLSALIDIWNINFLGYKTRALLPYSQGLAKLPAHTQQVEMESNGKSVTMDGKVIKGDTGEVVFGEPGTNGQHSFYQLLHQGTQIIPCDFIGFIKPQYEIEKAPGNEVTHHEELMTNFFAQPDALAFGQKSDNPHRNFPGGRPSSVLLLEKLTPFTAGLLLAWTEHRAAVKGWIWGINSFDQFGVELGKVLGKDHRRRIAEFNKTGKVDTKGLNPSTAALLERFLRSN